MSKQKEFITTEYNLELINKYAKNIDTGLFLLPSPTGSGKTHAIINFIIENIERGRKIVYVVPNHTNLDDFEKKLNLNLDSRFKDKVFKLKRTVNQLEEWYLNKDDNKYDLLSKYDEFIEINRILEILQRLKLENTGKKLYKTLIDEQENKLGVSANKLIKRIKKRILDFSLKNKSYDNLDFILEEQNNNEIKLLKDEIVDIFPFLKISKYSVILTTASKLAYKLNQLDSTKFLWAIDSFKNSYIFLDEFDSQKRYYLDAIINSKEKDIDIIELFRSIAKTFNNSRFDIKLNFEKDKFEEFKSRVLNIYNKYSLMYYIDTNLISDETSLPILIDSSFKGLNLQKNSNELYVKIDKKSQQLLIIDDKENSDFELSELILEVKNAIDSYVYLIKNIVLKILKSINNKFLSETVLQARIKDNVKIFEFSEEDFKYRYLFNRIIDDIDQTNGLNYSRFNFNSSLYEKGFSLINIQKKHLKSELTEINTYTLLNSPEKLLLNMCSKATVIGVSATSKIETVIKNFDLNYLDSKIKILAPNSDEILKMQNYYLDSKNQRNRVFNINILENGKNESNTKNDKNEEIISFLKRNFDNDLVLYEHIKAKNIDHYMLARYMNFIDCYKQFLLEDNIDSFLYFSNGYLIKYQDENYYFVMNLLIQMIMNLNRNENEHIKYLQEKIEEYGKNFLQENEKEQILYFLYNSENEDKYKKYLEINGNRKKFIFAVYSNIGTGKSLEYKKNGLIKDYDAIFLEKPTNIINRDLSTRDNKIKFIFSIKSLLESYQISQKEFIIEIKRAFSDNYFEKSVYFSTNDYNQALMQVIIQALGRVHRTNSTTPMYIFIENELAKSIQVYKNSNIPKLPSFIKLIEKSREINLTKNNNEDEQKLQNAISITNKKFNAIKNYLLQVFKTPNSNKDFEYASKVWKDIRELVLKHPTISKDDFLKLNNYQFLYIDINKNSYECYQKNDFEEVYLNKSTSDCKKVIVSEESAMLDILKNCKELEEFIEKEKIETQFKHPKLLIPVVFNNIYKGALGESIGKYIIEKYCNIKLQELDGSIEENYESFDFKNEQYKIYFDFKYYSQNSLSKERASIVSKVNYKLQQNRLKRALVINIFAEFDRKVEIIKDENLLIIPYLINSTNKEQAYIDQKMINNIKEYLNEK